ncbi:hypothetical protein [Streptomyces sp. GSL17-111]|uniref:hypothetical protein n=1 Tax=Streptomyces sp. GSL17-111 TaxID=3121596 RepID=UPI0030F3B4EF
MSVQLTHGTTTVLHHEAGGLLLRAGLVPYAGATAVTFQLGYLGHGRIVVDVVVGERPGEQVTLDGRPPGEGPGAAGTTEWTSLVPLPPTGSAVDLTYTVLGQPGEDDPLRGRLDCRLTGSGRRLSTETTAGICWEPLAA